MGAYLPPKRQGRREMRGFTHESVNINSSEWYTPPFVFQALDFTFDLDPCSPGEGNSFVPTRKHYTIEDDGLAQKWEGTVWMNPPYGAATPKWMKKLAEHGDGIALVAARTEVRWFHEHGAKADLICLVKSRIKFYQGNTTDIAGNMPGSGSIMLAYGDKAASVLANSGLGIMVRQVEGMAA